MLGLDVHKTKYSAYKKEGEALGLKIVFISDLHNVEFGEENKGLIEAVKEESPDLILLGGDLLNGQDDNTEIARTLMNNLSTIAKCYGIIGNHEKALCKKLDIDYDELFKDTGVGLLHNRYDTVEIKGKHIVVAGMTPWIMRSNELDADEIKFLNMYNNIDQLNIDYKIFMVHQPLLFTGALKDIDADLVLSGHLHGGQIQIPFIGGLYHPDFGLFPSYSQGKHSLTNGQIIIQRGIGNNAVLPRINNEPEILVIDI